jgi:tRNA-modifying protein YgfZ
MNSFFVELPNFETVLVKGADAAKFLQGQLTCDVDSLTENSFTYGAACNNKGRIFASFILARHDADFHVLLANGLASTFIANLQKFIPFYKCSMQILSGVQSIGVSGNHVGEALATLGMKIPPYMSGINEQRKWLYSLRPDNTQFIISAPADLYTSCKSSFESHIPEKNAEHWVLKNIAAGHFPFSLEDVDRYTPQELHFDQTGYVSFTKGCYTGQEIIARMHYRGKVKKQLYVLQLKNFTTESDEQAMEIFDKDGKSYGFPLKRFIDDDHTMVAIASLPVELAATSLLSGKGEPFTYRPLTSAAA